MAKALEYAYDDWCISVLADSLGDVETRDKYARFAGAYKSYFDPETRFMRGRDSKGNGVLRSILVRLPIAVTIIAKVRLGSGLGLCLTMCPVWLA